jgi:hypothetical protein
MDDVDWTSGDEERLQVMLKRARKRKSCDPENDDLALAISLLTGAWTYQGADPARKENDRHPAKRYFVDKSKLDKEAREAIGRLLRNRKPLNLTLRYQLAELFDGQEPYCSFDGQPMTRRIAFENRRSGEPTETKLRNLHLVSDYHDLIESGMPHKSAINQVCKKYGVSDTTVKKARRENPELARRTVKKRIERLK